jgi:Protein kinase domain
MICPRCGTRNHPQAPQCERCGLPFRVPGMPSQGGPWPTNPNQGGGSGSLPGGQPSQPYPPGQPRSRPIPPSQPQLGPTPNRMPYPNTPSNSSMRPPSQPGMLPSSGDLPYQGGASGQWDIGPLTPSQEDLQYRSMVPSGGSRAPAMSVGMPPTLAPGTVLRGNQLRVLAPFTPSRTANPRNLLTPWVAVDATRRGDRVVIVELPFWQLPPNDANTIREALTRRLQLISNHPNLQHVIGSFADQGRHFITMEFVEGTWLSERLTASGELREAMALGYASTLLDALDHLEHQSPPAVHGMITPDTIIIVPNDRQICLVGWDLATVANTIGLELPNVSPQNAVGFTSPEQQRGEYAPRADVYSLGATLYFALTVSDPTTRSAGIFPPVRQYNKTVSAESETILARALRLVPNQRYQHASDMQLDISRAMHGEALSQDPYERLEPIFKRGYSNTVVLMTIVSLVLAVAIVATLVVKIRGDAGTGPVTLAPAPTLNPTLQVLGNMREGLSTGYFIFDTSAYTSTTDNGSGTPVSITQGPVGAVLDETAAAAALRKGDFGTAVQYYQQAVKNDPSNGEARIYLEDTRIAMSKSQKYVTIVVVAPFNNDDVKSSESVLRSVALAQGTFNKSVTPGNVDIRVVVGSFGSDGKAGPDVSAYLADQVKNGNPDHILGVISWSPSNVTSDMATLLKSSFKTLNDAHIPVIAPLHTTDAVQPSDYLFELTGSNQYVAQAMSQVATQTYQMSRVVLVTDPTLTRSQEIADQLTPLLQAKLGGSSVVRDTLDVTIPNVDAKAIHDVTNYGANGVIYVGGTDNLVGIAEGLKNVQVPILAAPVADSVDVLAKGDPTIAAQVQSNPTAMNQVHILSYADSDEWRFVGAQSPTFFSDYQAAFSSSSNLLTEDASTILSYDAIKIMVNSLIDKKFWTDRAMPTPENLHDALVAYNGTSAYQGISGRIAFTQSHGPDNRSMVVKDVQVSNQTDANGHPILLWPVSSIWPTGSFCGTSTCQAEG